MQTYFAWVKANEVFDSIVHSRSDLEIFELSIDQIEGEVALARVTVPNSTLPPWNNRHIYISYDNNLLFSGRLVGLPVALDDELLSMEFTSEPLDASQQLQMMATELKKHPYWNASFVDPNELNNPTELLEARSALFAWDRTSGKVCLSNLFHGRHIIDVSNEYYAESLKIRLAETPISQISITLTVEWIQKAEGEVNLSGQISSAFPEGIMNTLTPKALKEKWFYEGQVLGRTGYWVVKSDLKIVTPPQTGVLNIYPTISPEFVTWDDGNQRTKIIRARRIWMSPILILGWRYHQKRRENVQFTLAQSTQLDGRIRPIQRELKIQLQQIDSVTSSYFLTSRGRQAIEHAIEIARAHLAASARCLEIELMLPFEAGISISMDHSIRLVSEKIPGGEVMGKIIAYRLYQDGLQSFTWVRFAVSIGGHPKDMPIEQFDQFVDIGYGDTKIPKQYQTVSGIFYENYEYQKPTQGIIDAESLTIHELLGEVFVDYDASRQIQELQRQQYPIRGNIKSVLEEIPTVVSLNLKNLKTSAIAEHTFTINLMNNWVAPRQINLNGEY
jgi:hypothetical protein